MRIPVRWGSVSLPAISSIHNRRSGLREGRSRPRRCFFEGDLSVSAAGPRIKKGPPSLRGAALMLWDNSTGKPVNVVSPSLEPVTDLVRPEPLETNQSLIEVLDVLGRHFADRLNGAQLAQVKLADDLAGFEALIREANTH